MVLAGTFPNATAPVIENIGGASANAPSKLLLMDKDGVEVEKIYNLGAEIYDMDRTNDDKIALIGSFGVMVLNDDFSIAWSDTSAVPQSKVARISIAETGEVVAFVPFAGDKTGMIHLYNSNGDLMHINDLYSTDTTSVYVRDVEIATTNGHNAYYVSGYRQAARLLQIAFVRAFDIANNVNSKWKSFGFPYDPSMLSSVGADTRIYRLKAAENSLYFLGESAGGGPGGFSIFAYNGKDFETKVADKNNDNFSNGINSGGSWSYFLYRSHESK